MIKVLNTVIINTLSGAMNMIVAFAIVLYFI